MGRRRHAARRPLRHAQVVRTLRAGRGHCDGGSYVKRDAAQTAVHARRELLVQVVQRHTASALGAGHRAGAVRLQDALRVRGQRRVRSRERRRCVRDPIQGAQVDGHNRTEKRVPLRSGRRQEPGLPVPAGGGAGIPDADSGEERVVRVVAARMRGARDENGRGQIYVPRRR